jgi:hypothetical protein
MPFAPCLDSTISSLPRQLKVAPRGRLDIICLPQKCGCSSVVERLVANEKVASSTLVTRSSLRLERSAKRRLGRVRRSDAKAGRREKAKLRLAGQLSECTTFTFSSRSRIQDSDTSVQLPI